MGGERSNRRIRDNWNDNIDLVAKRPNDLSLWTSWAIETSALLSKRYKLKELGEDDCFDLAMTMFLNVKGESRTKLFRDYEKATKPRKGNAVVSGPDQKSSDAQKKLHKIIETLSALEAMKSSLNSPSMGERIAAHRFKNGVSKELLEWIYAIPPTLLTDIKHLKKQNKAAETEEPIGDGRSYVAELAGEILPAVFFAFYPNQRQLGSIKRDTSAIRKDGQQPRNYDGPGFYFVQLAFEHLGIESPGFSTIYQYNQKTRD